jgi:hypothetical protein
MELRRKLLEKTLEAQTPHKKSICMQEMSKGRNIRKGSETTDVARPTSPLISSSARKSSLDIQGKQEVSQKSPTSPTKGEKNRKLLNKKLREDQDHIIKLKEEKKISEDGIVKMHVQSFLMLNQS